MPISEEKKLIKLKVDELNAYANTMSARDTLAAYNSAQEALVLAEESDYKTGRIYALFYMGESLYRQGKAYAALDRLRESLNLTEEIGDLLPQSMIYTTLGNVHLNLQLFDLAFYYYRLALSACEELKRYESQAMILNNIGEIYRELGDYEKAIESYAKCLDICEKNNFVRVGMYATANIGVVDYQTQKYKTATYFLEKSIVTAKELNNHIIEGFSLRYLGLVHMDLSEYELARKEFEKALLVYKKSNEIGSEAQLYKDYAQVAFNENNCQEVLDYLEKAHGLAAQLQDTRLLISIYSLFIKVYQKMNEDKKASEYCCLIIKLEAENEIKENANRLRSIDFQIKSWDALKESKKYQEINKELQEKTKNLEKVTKEMQKINKEIKELSDMDGLTRIANRVRLDEYAQDICQKAYKNKVKVAMMIIDIDNFKEYNDFYGHLIGDDALIKIAKILKKSIENKEGLAARFGGDEFVMIIYDCSLEETKKIAKNITSTLKNKKIVHENSNVNPYLTVSIGLISKIPQKKTTYALLMDFADQALYQAKAKGKNQTEVYSN